MVRRVLVLALLVACGTTKDDRPRTIAYVTEAVLAPTCGGAECHSEFSQNRGDIFDTVAGARASLVHNLLSFDSTQYDPGKPDNSALIIWITQDDPFGLNIGRMPYDAPLPNADVNFLKQYIREGAPGAQCDPDEPELHCNNTVLSTCNKDWNFDQQILDCTGAGNGSGCAGGACECKPGFGDCDGNPRNGCELHVNTNTDCGSCGHACATGTTCQMTATGDFSCQ
jgi:hypothetical protein